MNPGVTAQAFTSVFLAELPDKTMVATLVLTSRTRRPVPVWCGVAAAFTLHVAVAVGAGTLLSRLPPTPVQVAAGVLFLTGAVVLWRSSDEAPEDAHGEGGNPPGGGALRVSAMAFVVVGLAEWGDLTQLATAALTARTGDGLSVGVGALAALWSVAALGAALGSWLLRVIHPRVVRRLAAALFLGIGVWTLVEALT